MGALKKLLLLTIALFILPNSSQAQSFSSGSTGADGALDLSTMNCPNDICIMQLPESGILNYTTVNIPSGKTLVFKNNSRNTPVIMLAQGNVSITGSIDVSAPFYFYVAPLFSQFSWTLPHMPGPGGFYGGDSEGYRNGFGAGGGVYNPGDSTTWSGRWVGPLSLAPIVGGSGGAGHPCCFNGRSNGGGGGGALLIASSTSISMSGIIRADGYGEGDAFGSASGSGGAIRLVANSLSVSGSLGAVNRRTFSPNPTNQGVVRLEAPSGALSFTGSSQPAAVLSPVNSIVYASAIPTLRITSVGGFTVPSYAGSRFDTVDLLLPSQLADPIVVGVAANNVPVGTQVSVGMFGSSNGTTTLGTLSGTFENSTAAPTVSNLTRASVTYLIATAAFDPPMGAMIFNPKGADHVAKIRMESGIATKPKLVFLRQDGTAIDQRKLPKKFLEQFGL
jgi:hypothetical protein